MSSYFNEVFFYLGEFLIRVYANYVCIYTMCSARVLGATDDENTLQSRAHVRMHRVFLLSFYIPLSPSLSLSLSLSPSLHRNQIFRQILCEPERPEPLLADEFEQLVVAHHELFILRIHQIVLLEIFPHLLRQLCSVDGLLSA